MATAGEQLIGALDAEVEDRHGVVDCVLVVDEVRKLLQETAGLGVDFDVADQIGIGVLRLRLFTSASIC
jgi:hypothetical protein